MRPSLSNLGLSILKTYEDAETRLSTDRSFQDVLAQPLEDIQSELMRLGDSQFANVQVVSDPFGTVYHICGDLLPDGKRAIENPDEYWDKEAKSNISNDIFNIVRFLLPIAAFLTILQHLLKLYSFNGV